MRALSQLSAAEVVQLLRLQPHPEYGHYRETFRDKLTVAGGRSASTAIYFLLRAGEVSRWHRVDAVEIWHWYGGGPLEIGLTSGPPPVIAETIEGIATPSSVAVVTATNAT